MELTYVRQPPTTPTPTAGGPTPRRPTGRARITYRPATAADTEAALAISAHFPDDWLAHGIGPMLAAGTFFVAEVGPDPAEGRADGAAPVDEQAAGLGDPHPGRRVIAVCGYEVLGDVAWLQAMRVHPDYHNLGIATDFTRYLLERCRQAGLRRARLDTTVDNHPVHHFIQSKLGFRPRGNFCFARLGCDPDDPPALLPVTASAPATTAPAAPVVRKAQPRDFQRIWTYLEQQVASGQLAPAGLISPPDRGGDVIDFGPAELERWLEAGNVLVAEAGGVTGVAFWGRAERARPSGPPLKQVRVTCLEGEPAVQVALLDAVLDLSANPVRPAQVALRLPRSQWLTLRPLLNPAALEAMEAADHFFEAVVYERELGGDRPNSG